MPEVLRPRDIGGLLGQTFTITFSKFWKLLAIQLIFWVPVIVLLAGGLAALVFLEGTGPEASPVVAVALCGGIGIFALVVWFLSPLPAAASILAIADSFTGDQTPISACYAAAIRRIFPLFLLTILIGLILLGGFFMCCIGHFYFLARFYVAIQVLMLERKGIGDSLGRSWDLTKDYFWPVLGFAMIIWLIQTFLGGAVNQAAQVAFMLTGSEILAAVGPMVVQSFTNVLTGMLVSVAAVVVYFDLRTRIEALDLHGLIDLVDEIGPRKLGGGAPS